MTPARIRYRSARTRTFIRARWCAQRRLAREAECGRQKHLALLAETARRLTTGSFTERELLEAEAALRVPPGAPQAQLLLHGGDADAATGR